MTNSSLDSGARSNLVNEGLRTLRLLHQVLILVGAAVLVFALRPDPTEEYKTALNELSTLKEVPFGQWPIFINEHYKKHEDQNNEFVVSLIRNAGLRIQGDPKLQQPIFGDVPPFLDGAKLVDFDAFFTGARKIGVVSIEGDRRSLSEQIKKIVAMRNANPRISFMSLSGVGSSGYFGLSDWRNVPLAGPAALQLVVNDQPQTVPNQPLTVIVSYKINSETGSYALEWLRGEAFGQRLLDQKGEAIFPHLKVFWDRVSSLTDNEATVFLQEELSSTSRGTLSFFGIPVERGLALSAGPIACLSILLFLGLHLGHCRTLAIDRESIAAYPWVPLFRTFMAQAATYISVLCLPTIANVILLKSYGHWAEWGTKIGTFLTVFGFFASIWVIVEIGKLREQTRNRS